MFEFLDFNYSTTQLMMIWIFAGFACFIPFFMNWNWQKYLIVPIVFAAIYISFDTNKDFIGKPQYGPPEGKWTYLVHRVDQFSKQKYITLWVIIKGDDKLYRFLYNKEQAKKLEIARKRSQKGIRQIGEFAQKVVKAKRKGTHIEKFELRIYDFPHQKLMPKTKN